jgi:hypothetical protein
MSWALAPEGSLFYEFIRRAGRDRSRKTLPRISENRTTAEPEPATDIEARFGAFAAVVLQAKISLRRFCEV